MDTEVKNVLPFTITYNNETLECKSNKYVRICMLKAIKCYDWNQWKSKFQSNGKTCSHIGRANIRRCQFSPSRY